MIQAELLGNPSRRSTQEIPITTKRVRTIDLVTVRTGGSDFVIKKCHYRAPDEGSLTEKVVGTSPLCICEVQWHDLLGLS